MQPEWEVLLGDCLEHLKGLPDNYFDSMVMDPPAGISFMGKDWDHHKGGRDQWIAWLAAILRECLRVTKPGGHAVVWALPRTSFWTGMALDDAGWEIRDVITHLFGSGFPKSRDISKAIDTEAGATREVVGVNVDFLRRNPVSNHKQDYGEGYGNPSWRDGENAAQITAPATEQAAQWAGWGTALKPAAEFWYVARKPFDGTVADNVLSWGVGGFNIDACRIGTSPADAKAMARCNTPGSGRMKSGPTAIGTFERSNSSGELDTTQGRWPANVVLSHTPECRQVGTRQVRGANWRDSDNDRARPSGYSGGLNPGYGKHYADDDGLETVPHWECSDDCPVAILDRQSGDLPISGRQHRKEKSGYGFGDDGYGNSGIVTPQYLDTGGASRFFYQAKPSPKERNMGLEGLPKKVAGAYGEFAGDGRGRQTEHSPAANTHPTVKSIRLMTYLIRLVTPPGGRVGDPFTGSGSTGVAAMLGGWSFWGCDLEPDHVTIARARIAHSVAHPQMWTPFLKDIDTGIITERDPVEPSETPQPVKAEDPPAPLPKRPPLKRGRKGPPEGVEQLILF